MTSTMNNLMDAADPVAPELIDVSNHSDTGFTLTFDIRRIIRVLVSIVMALAIAGTVADIIKFHVAPSPTHRLARLMNRLILGFEPSIPNWYSSTALLSSAAMLALIGLAKLRARDRFAKHWLALSLLFVVCSIDEAVRLHELIHTVMIHFVEPKGLFRFPFAVPATLFVLTFAIVYLPFLKHIDRKTARRFVVAGGIYVFGTVVMEVLGGLTIANYGAESLQHTFSQLVEELCEMLGIVVFLYALMDYVRRRIGAVRVNLA